MKHPGSVYRRLETDREFRDRMYAAKHYIPPERAYGVGLDDYVWGAYKKQRRIIEVEA